MERLKIKNIVILIILIAIFVPTFLVLAADDLSYTVLAPLPGVGDDGTGKTTLEKYVPAMFKLAIGLSAVWAVLMIVLGGIQYISTDAIMKKTEGRERIKNAVLGLVLVIAAWLILATINPALLEFKLEISPATTTAPPGVGGTLGTVSATGVSMTTQQIADSNTVRASLALQGVETYRDPCTQGQTTNCVNLNGLTGATKDGLILTKSGCNCTMIITGGTEGGHSATGDHPTGSAVDLKPDQSLNTVLGFPSPKEGDTKTKVFKIDGKPDITAVFTYETLGGNAAGTSSGNHWHVSFK